MTDIESRVCGIFNVRGVRYESKVKIDHVQNVTLKTDERFMDSPVKRIPVMKGVIAEVYNCNMTDLFLLSTKKLPVMYVNVINERPMRRILLYRIYLYFTIDAKVDSATDLLTKELDGKFTVELSIDGGKQVLDDSITRYEGDERTCDKLVTFATGDDMKEMVKDLITEIDEKLARQYSKEFEYLQVPKKTISLKDYSS